MAYPKLLALVTQLHQNTALGSIEWEKTDRPNVYQKSFANYAVRIHKVDRASRDGQDISDYMISIFNDNGDQIEEANDEELDAGVGNEFWKKLKETYEIARRQATGSDAALDEILKELSDDEIPF